MDRAGALAALGGIYLGQSLIGGLTFQATPALLRASGHGLELIGLLPLLMLPQALKFLWAPAVERLRLPAAGGRRSRRIILAGQVVAAALILLLATGSEPGRVLPLLALAAVVAATLDIACDAFATEQLPPRAYGWGNAMQVGGAYLGLMLGGGLFLVAVERLGWTPAIIALAALLLLAGVPLWRIVEAPLPVPGQAAPPGRPSLRLALARPEMRRGLGAVVLVQLGLRMVLAIQTPFLVDAGLRLEALGLLSGLAGTAASLLGTLLAAAAAARRGPFALIRPLLAAQAVLFLALAAAAAAPGVPLAVPVGLALLLALVTGMTFVSVYAAMMGWARGAQPGVDFSLLQCADALTAALAGSGAVALAGWLGYQAGFALAALPALLAAGLLGRTVAGRPALAEESRAG
ncbi:MFS transporter [Siccirubricoccus phaeus]|uniref:MFS transporter n=1 Tax=Siccirubricoccus phaeus TaxID=2595053 RepID=UPI00165B2F3D|nr:MFS transporter [Siccirubricoccus phaeus]